MRRSLAAALTLCIALGALLGARSADAAVPGYDSAYAGESDFTSVAGGGAGSFSVRFTNTGALAWARNVVGLLACRDDKLTCNVAPEEAAYASGWHSPTVYATVSSDTSPGSTAFFIYSFAVPVGTLPGTPAVFNGDVGLIATGQTFRPEGYFQTNTTPIAPGGALAISPTTGAVRVGGQIQFTATNIPPGGTPSWSVLGGCGVVTSSGLFVAVATNAPTQPCSVVVAAAGLSATASVTVFGAPTSITCAASAGPIVANGTNTAVVTGTLKDGNGNVVLDDNVTSVTMSNNTPTLITPGGVAAVVALGGVATRTYTTTTAAGEAQVSLTSSGLVGCNTIFTTVTPGVATKTAATADPSTIGADGASTSRIRVTVQDISGNTVIADSFTQVSLTRLATSANLCTPATFGPLAMSAGVATFTMTSTTTPGACTYDVTPNNVTIAGTSVTVTTAVVGAPSRLTVVSSTSPQTVNVAITVVVELRDAAGARVTNPTFANQSVQITHACTGLTPTSGTNISMGTSGPDAGRATFTLSSTATMTNCLVTFSSAASIFSTNTTVTYTPGPNHHLSCAFLPEPIAANGVSQSTATVRAVDSFGNPTGTGTFATTFTRTSGTAAIQLTSSPQNMANGAAQFIVRSGTSPTVDTFTAFANVNGVTGDETAPCSITMQ